LTLAGLLALARHVCAADRAMKAARWEKKAFAGTELRGATLGIVGFGRIGRAVAALARAFGMRVIAHDPVGGAPEPGVERVTLDALCAAADYVTLHVPVSDETRGLFDTARLGSCRRGVRLVNTARGELVDAAALVAALDSGQVGGAAIDVFAPEPPTDWSLATHPRVVATPHLAASTREAQLRVGIETAEAVRDYLRDGRARSVVTAR
jgi:D-3-phosphoglycerate dehydrogenase